MSTIYVLIPLAIIIVLVAIGIFFWAVKSDQFNDLERQGYSILFDDDAQPKPPASSKLTEQNQNIRADSKPDEPLLDESLSDEPLPETNLPTQANIGSETANPNSSSGSPH